MGCVNSNPNPKPNTKPLPQALAQQQNTALIPVTGVNGDAIKS